MMHTGVESRVLELFQGGLGLHCAESVLIAVVERFEPLPDASISRIATCFGGGVGKTKADMCGALAGGVIALGYLRGRTGPGQDWSDLARLTAEFRKRFQDSHTSTRCSEILTALGKQEEMDKCKQLSANTARLLCDLVSQACR